jgi:dTDP-4-dehydrorhamnose reductase
MKKKILMTGASGLVGSRFIEMYADKYDIGNLDLTTGVDILNPDSLRVYLDANPGEVLIHLAAFTDTAGAEQQKGDKTGLCYKLNVEGTQRMVDACRERSIHLLHISTDFVFDGTKETPYLEDDHRNPLDWYGQTKAVAEDVVTQSGIPYTIARIAYPYRAVDGQKPDIIMKVRAGLESGTLKPQFTDTLMTPTFIDDISRSFDAIISKKPTGIFHCVGSQSLSPYDLAQLVAETYGHDKSLVQKGSLQEYLKENPRPFAVHLALNNTKAHDELGLDFATVEDGIRTIKKQQEKG